MKRKFVILIFLISVKLFGCKCDEMSIQESFKYADFVFIGKIYEVIQFPSGFKTINDFVSKVNIKKIYKLNAYDEYYTKNATLFSSQLRSCDLFYNNDTEYLIFGYIESDTGLIYSEFCTQTKPLNNVSKEDIQTLENLKDEYSREKNKENSIVIKPLIEDFTNQPNTIINRLKIKTDLAEFKYEKIKTENQYLKIIVIIIFGVFLIIMFLFRKKIKK